jgi:sortase (surface protein transpeptidase)
MSRGGRRRAALAAAVAVLVVLAPLLAGCSGSGARRAQPPAVPGTARQPDQPDRPSSGVEAARGFHSARSYRATPVPTRIVVPRIGVASSLQRLGRRSDGTVEEPSRWEVAGWYAHGPRPGDPGSAVILGHVDSKRGPAVFYRLRELRPGDRIDVTRADGSSVRFVVERTAQYDKQRFPTDEVYYPTFAPALRLVTCGGTFDASAGHYRSNIIVFAKLET